MDNVHPGEILREDFLIGSEIPLTEVASGAGIEKSLLKQLLKGKVAVDANIDLRLGRYFGMSEGFFLRLQNCYDLEEERRAHGDELARIAKRAA
ncbi:MAG: HigA family addiction module antitoxin [Sphingomonadaceae bacterium]